MRVRRYVNCCKWGRGGGKKKNLFIKTLDKGEKRVYINALRGEALSAQFDL